MADENKNNEEEVALSGHTGPTNDSEASTQESPKPETTSPLAEVITPGMSDEAILDAVLSAPSDSLIPWEQVTLPSKGLYYGWTSGVIDVRAWGIQTDKILATQRLAQSGQAIDYVLTSCCRFPDGFDPSSLLVGDQVFLLYYLRGITHGNMYEFIASTPGTNNQNTYVIDLNELASTITFADASLGQEPFRIELPYMSSRLGRPFHIGLRFLRVRDSQNIMRTKRAINRTMTNSAQVKKRRKKEQWSPGMPANRGNQPGAAQAVSSRQPVSIDDTVSKNLELLIMDAMGSTDRSKIRQLVSQLHAKDTAVIREWLADHSPGIETTVELTDPSTSETFQVMLPITESFFRPQDGGAMRT